MDRGPFKRVAILGDTHFPFEDVEALSYCYAIIEKFKPEVVVQIGDLYDALAWSKYPSHMERMSPETEMREAKRRASIMWKTVQSIAPEAKCYQIKGNHDERPYKRLIEKAPELASFIDLRSWWNFDSVSTIHDSREPLIIDGIGYVHGWLSGEFKHAQYFNMPIVRGHSHRGGCVWKRHNRSWLFELDTGYLGSPEISGYVPSKITNWTRGIGLITEWGPSFIPFEID